MKTIKSLIFVALMFSLFSISAQDIQREKFIFGVATGGGMLLQKDKNADLESYGKISILNLKLGYMVSPNTALCIHVPSGGHKENGETRAFEASLITAQHWFADRFWASAGVGLAMDMPPFYDTKIEDPDFYFGPAASIGAGYEVWRKGKFALDLKGRILYGNYDVEGVRRQSTAFDILVGFNWY
jgi:hypothetical protein